MYLSRQDLSDPNKPSHALVASHEIQDWPLYYQSQARLQQAKACQQLYQQGLPAKDLGLTQIPLVALDFETTGLNAQQDQILAIGIVPFRMDHLATDQAKQWLIRNQRPLAEENVIIHGITDSQAQSGISLEQAMTELLKALSGKVVVVHYRPIEQNFINAASLSIFDQGLQLPMIDTMAIERRLVKQNWQQRWQEWWRPGSRSLRLDPCRQRYGLPSYRPHHACSDALATAELLLAQYRHLGLDKQSWHSLCQLY